MNPVAGDASTTKRRIKRTCEGCVADKFGEGKYCILRYRRKLVRILKGVQVFSAPDEECPKPKTWRDYSNTPVRPGPGRE